MYVRREGLNVNFQMLCTEPHVKSVKKKEKGVEAEIQKENL